MERVGLISLRKQYGLTQSALAEAIGYSRQAVIKWEKGSHPIPDDVEARLLAADLAAPAMQKNAGKVINPASHPACYHHKDKISGHARTLLHPKWWAGTSTPFKRLCSEAEWKQLDLGASVLDLAAYVAPTIEQAHELMVSRGISFVDASGYLKWMGYALPATLQVQPTAEQIKSTRYNTALAQWNIDNPETPGWAAFEAANPQFRESGAAPSETGEPPAELVKAFNSAFGLSTPKQDE